MRTYFLNRLLQSLLLLLVILTVNFFLFRVMPGDPVRLLFHDPRITAEQQERLSRLFGLDKPLIVQYGYYLVNTLRGDLGMSFFYREPVAPIIFKRLANTIILLLPSVCLSILIGGFLGSISAWKRGTKLDAAIFSSSLLFWSTPLFWLGLAIILLFIGIWPISGMKTAGADYPNLLAQVKDLLSHMALPLITETLVLQAQYTMIMRSSLLDVLTEDYIVTARSRGFAEKTVLRKYAVPNAMLPMITLIAINMGLLVAGAIQVETVFSWPGVGRLMYDSIIQRDYPLLQGAFLIVAISVIVANLIADLIYGYLDPRVRIGGAKH
jgi:peptide/nickel transport system permease protein